MSGNDSHNDFPPDEAGGGAAGGGGGDAPLNTGRPAVAAAPGKLIFVLLFAGIFIFIIVRSLFFGEKPEVKEVHHGKESVTAENSRSQSELSISPGSLPAPPTAELTSTTTAAPPPPPPPPPPPALLTPPNPEVHGGGGTNDEALNRRIHSPMLAVNGGVPKSPVAVAKQRGAVADISDPNGAFAQNISLSSAEKKAAGKITDLRVTIAQGKLIHAILESAINSSLPGPIRAVVSHDTYAEAGRDILIPKGSRIIGTYNSSIRRGQSRVFIVWQRIIRPDGVDIMVDSSGIDALGRAGMSGEVDNKYFELFSAAILTSSLDIGVAAVGDALFGNQQTTSTSGAAGTTTTQSPTATAMQTAVQNISNVGANIVQGVVNTTPTIIIDQGTPIEVFVNSDLLFPPGLSSPQNIE